MKRGIMNLVFLALLLAGCGGNIASPTTTDYQSTTTTTTTTANAEMTQTHNRSVCVGILNIGSCNTVQVNTQTQTVNRPAGSPAPAPNNMDSWNLFTTLIGLLAVFGGCIALGSLLMGSRGYN